MLGFALKRLLTALPTLLLVSLAVFGLVRAVPGDPASIMLGDMSYLDADKKDPKANPGFAAFGQVVEGLEVIRKIIVMPTDPNRGEGAMKGEMLVKPVRITKVSRGPG